MINFENFAKAVKTAVTKVLDDEDLKIVLTTIVSRGSEFDFDDDAGIDSLDMLEILFYVSQETGMRTPPFEGSTLGELYDAFIAHNQKHVES